MFRSKEVDGRLPVAYCGVSGAIAGMVSSLFSCPVELTRLKMQIPEAGTDYRGSLDAAFKIARGHGLSRIYKGYLPTLGRDGLGYTVYFSYYKKAMEDVPSGKRLSWSILHGGTAGLLFWLATYPLDVVKSKMQNDSVSRPAIPTMRHAARAIFAQGGLAAFYRGYSVVIVRAFPTNSAGFLAY